MALYDPFGVDVTLNFDITHSLELFFIIYFTEFRNQLVTLENLLAHVPSCVIRELIQNRVAMATANRKQRDEEFQAKLNDWSGTKVMNIVKGLMNIHELIRWQNATLKKKW